MSDTVLNFSHEFFCISLARRIVQYMTYITLNEHGEVITTVKTLLLVLWTQLWSQCIAYVKYKWDKKVTVQKILIY